MINNFMKVSKDKTIYNTNSSKTRNIRILNCFKLLSIYFNFNMIDYDIGLKYSISHTLFLTFKQMEKQTMIADIALGYDH